MSAWGSLSGSVVAHLKKATRDKDRSSRMVREEAKMERRTAGVTGGRRVGSDAGSGWGKASAGAGRRAVADERVDVVEGGINDDQGGVS